MIARIRVCPIFRHTRAITRMSITHPTSQRIGQAVREERKRQGLDQQTLALVADVGERSIYRIEHGEQTVRLDIVLRVLTALGLQLDIVARNAP